jgi:hypothetical protein
MPRKSAKQYEEEMTIKGKICEERMEFAMLLERKGHKCITLSDNIPFEVMWCLREVCVSSETGRSKPLAE